LKTRDNNSVQPRNVTEVEADAAKFEGMMNSDAPVEDEQLPAGPLEGASKLTEGVRD
jgi:hypothetical protein